MLKSYLKVCTHATQTYKANDIATIYKFPQPPTTPVTVSVISFGGGLFGDVSPSGVVTNSDMQAYWTSIGIPLTKQPKVIVLPISGATNTPVADQGATSENTIDVSMIGACCPTATLTILLFISSNSLSEFPNLITRATSPVTVDGVVYTPSVLSISWGAAEIYYTGDQLTTINALLKTVSQAGINVCVATGDDGSSDGVAGKLSYVDFPSSSPYVTACGGTNLICPTLNYKHTTTVETAWSSGGGGVSGTFLKPSWQVNLQGAPGLNRCLPDISLVADPSTAVQFIIGGKTAIMGGTSIVAPAMAAYYACINSGKFLLPALYAANAAAPTAFNDITVGSNGAYTASKGFDLCTGFGSINGDILAAQLASVTPPTTIPVSGLSLDTTSVSLPIGSQKNIVALIAPTNATNKEIVWSSSTSAATVVGITCPAAAAAKNHSVCTCASPSIVTCGCEEPAVVACACARIVPCGCSGSCACGCASGLPCTCNHAAAPCDSVGLVTAVSIGTTTITARTVDGGFTATALVTVVAAPPPTPVTGITLDIQTLNMPVGSQRQLVATIAPINATNRAVTWGVTGTSASVSNTGLVTALSLGQSTVTVKTVDGGFTAAVVVNVVLSPVLIPVTGVTVDVTSASLAIGATKQLTATVLPANASNRTVTWSSSTAAATVSSTGLVKGISAGTATITVKTADGGFTATTSITVTSSLISLSFFQPSIFLFAHTTYQSYLVFNPPSFSGLPVTYTSSAPTIASINSSGLITANAQGQVKITAVAGGKTATMYVQVYPNYYYAYYATQSQIAPHTKGSFYNAISNTGMTQFRR